MGLGSLLVAAKVFNTEEERRTTEGHGEGMDALRAKRCFLSPWSSEVSPSFSVLNPFRSRGRY
jgi:hypothetical protein